MTTDFDRSMDEIEVEIARTRARLAGEADLLAAELAPPRLVEKGADMVNGILGRIGKIGRRGGGGADPAAFALIGLGIAWLVAENLGLLDEFMSRRGDEPAPPAEKFVALPVEEPARPSAGDGWLHQAASAAQGALRSVYDRSGAAIEQAGGFIAHPIDSGERVRQAGGRMIDAVERTPLLLGLAGIAAGAAIAMLLPASRREREIAIQARNDLWDKAEELGHRAATSMREMAEGSARATADY
jgi:Protein of unknown function (DUF3618)